MASGNLQIAGRYWCPIKRCEYGKGIKMSGNDNQYRTGFGGQLSAGVNYSTTQPPAERNAAQTSSQAQPLHGMVNFGGAPEQVLDISTDQFESEVIEASNERPVLIDFWAPWCGPCKQLAPALEKVVAKTAGKVKLVKMNIDEHPEIAGHMGIQSIPAVVAFVGGRPKDAFMGSKSEREIEQFVAKLAGTSGPSPLEQALEQAGDLAAHEAYEQAGQIYSSILAQLPDNTEALVGLATVVFRSGDTGQAKEILSSVSGQEGNREIAALKAAIDLQEQAAGIGGDIAKLQAEIENDPKNHKLRLDLAIALNATGNKEAAADQLLASLRLDLNWNEGAAKTQLLQFFEAWGPKDPETLSARRQLSSLLFS